MADVEQPGGTPSTNRAPIPAYLPGYLYAIGEGVLRRVKHRVDESVRPIRFNGWTWFAFCGALVQPTVAPREGWPYCPICWYLGDE